MRIVEVTRRRRTPALVLLALLAVTLVLSSAPVEAQRSPGLVIETAERILARLAGRRTMALFVEEAGAGEFRFTAPAELRNELPQALRATPRRPPAGEGPPAPATEALADVIEVTLPRARALPALAELGVPLVGTRPALRSLARKPVAALVASVESLEAARALVVSDSTPTIVADLASLRLLRQAHPGKLFLLQRSARFENFEALKQPVTKVRVIADVPVDERAFLQVHGRDPTPEQLEFLRAAAAKLQGAGATPLTKLRRADETARQAALREFNNAKPGEAIVFLGHNSNGVAKFADGSTLLLTELDDLKKPLTVVSCNGLRHASGKGGTLITTDARIDYQRGAGIVETLGKTPGSLAERLRLLDAQGLTGLLGLAGAPVFLVHLEDAA